MKLYFRFAAMNSGKSTALLQIAHNYEERGVKVLLFTSAHDDRFGLGFIASRLGIKREAVLFNKEFSFENYLAGKQVGCVLVDEAQFLTEKQVWELHKYCHVDNVPVLCFGLRTDFLGKAFEGSATLLAVADDLEELKTICGCGKKATFNIRVDAQGNRILHGEQVAIESDKVRYDSVCGDCLHKK